MSLLKNKIIEIQELLTQGKFDIAEKYVDKLLPTVNGYGWGCHPFDRETDRYKKVLHIAEDYVSSRKLTDMRLSGRIIDRIM